jgi:hypothetical protein
MNSMIIEDDGLHYSPDYVEYLEYVQNARLGTGKASGGRGGWNFGEWICPGSIYFNSATGQVGGLVSNSDRTAGTTFLALNPTTPIQEIANQMRSDASGWMNGISTQLNVAGLLNGAGEYYNAVNGMWKGVNGKWYSLEWGGNQWTGARANAVGKAYGFKMAGRACFYIGAFISGSEGVNAIIEGNDLGVFKAGVDIGISALATFGGPAGLVIGGGYFLFDPLNPPRNPNPTYRSPYINLPDNTYVAPPFRY